MLRYKNGIVIDRYRDNDGNKKEVWCVWRDSSEFSYTGCPFNKPGKELFEDYCERMNVVNKT